MFNNVEPWKQLFRKYRKCVCGFLSVYICVFVRTYIVCLCECLARYVCVNVYTWYGIYVYTWYGYVCS